MSDSEPASAPVGPRSCCLCGLPTISGANQARAVFFGGFGRQSTHLGADWGTPLHMRLRQPMTYTTGGALLALGLFGVTPGCGCASGGSTAGAEGSTGETDSGTAETEASDTENEPPEATPSATTRRLSNRELSQSLLVLTGVQPPALSRLPPETDGLVFDRIVNGQTTSRSHLEAHLAIADQVASTLLAEQRLDDLTSACADEILPPATPQILVAVNGSSFSGAPQWACVVQEDQPTQLFCQYSGVPAASYSHNFSAPGTYEIELDLNTNASVDTLDIVIGGNLVESYSNIAGDFVATATVQIPEAAATPITFALTTAPEDNNLAVRFGELRVEGPLDPTLGLYDAEQQACGSALVDTLGPLAFRRPLNENESERLHGLFTEGHQNDGFSAGLRMLFEGILANANFLYLVEIGDAVDGDEGAFALRPWELAARLSYALCERPPDAALRDAAASGALADVNTLEEHARRLLAQPCGRATVRRFYEQWLELDELPELNKSPETFPEFDEDVRAGLISESARFIDEMLWSEKATLEELFTTNLAWPDPRSAALWGLQGVTEQERVTLGDERAGILTLPGVLAATGEFDGTSPVTRGVFVLEHLLCDELEPPPEDLEIVPPPPDPGLSTRDRWAAHSSVPGCSACHALIDPPGFALENFDGIGRHRTLENGVAVDARGGAVGLDEEVEGGAELSRALATSQVAAACFAKQWLRFSLGRWDTEQDAQSLEALSAAARSQDMSEVLVTIVSSRAFRHRFEANQ